ncbi:MAG: hypothetical protein K8823_566 [Cenarchaeum symbiont of Oopsacas minuta]|nr:hypothetical protein [Cenarchaeum symbiont of Oopsacas minuta]
MELPSTPKELRNSIVDMIQKYDMPNDPYLKMLDYVVELFEKQGLGIKYYGYHNVMHELEVTYVSMLASSTDSKMTFEDMKYLYVAALLHDFEPQKDNDKPHEQKVTKFISNDATLQNFISRTGLSSDIIEALILRTAYPWEGKIMESSMRIIDARISKEDDKNDLLEKGLFLSIVDRISGYSLGGFTKGMEMAKKNSHALGWHPANIVRRTVEYFERMMNNETVMFNRIVRQMPKLMRDNLMDNIISFMKLRQMEINTMAKYLDGDLKLVPIIEKPHLRSDADFINNLETIYNELPGPLQVNREHFKETLVDKDTILTTLRHDDADGEIIGYAKGGPLEMYNIEPMRKDENYGKNNTVFLESFAIKMGYWGMHGGSEMRHMFTMQAHSKNYTYLTSFAHRDVINMRIRNLEDAEFIVKFDPEKWDYYRTKL